MNLIFLSNMFSLFSKLLGRIQVKKEKIRLLILSALKM